MDYEHITKMLDKTFSWAINRTFSREEAEELTQEILFQAVRCIGELKDPSKFVPWFWRLANIQLQVFKRSKIKSRSYISFDILLDADLSFEDDYNFIAEDEYQRLRRRIAQMSANYRDIIVMYYYDNLSCKTIAQKLGLPEGTVTYRLSMAREKLKKECSLMTETALKPAKLNITIMGDFRNEKEYPPQFINDFLSQNILWHCYHEQKTVEQLSILTGVPAVYIEDRIENLIKREAVMQPTKTTVQTDFLIFDEITGGYGNDLVENIIETVSDEFHKAAHTLTEKTLSTGIQTAGRSFDEIMCFLSVLLLSATVPDSMPEYLPGKLQHFPQRYDGYKWKYIGFMGEYYNPYVSMGAERSMNNFEKGKMAHYNYNFAPFMYRKFMFDYEIDVCQAVLQKEALDGKQKEIAAKLIANGFLVKTDDGKIICTVPVFTKEQHDIFARTAVSVFADFLPIYSRKIKEFVDGYVKLFPKHLKDDALFNGFNIFAAMFKAIANDWVQRGKINLPDGAVCDALMMM
jgi:RNA polymerase sigma-70 factor (ECF subfamily)